CFTFYDPPPTAVYTLSLHDALPICSFLRTVRQALTSARPSAARAAQPCAGHALSPWSSASCDGDDDGGGFLDTGGSPEKPRSGQPADSQDCKTAPASTHTSTPREKASLASSSFTDSLATT